MTEQKTTSSIIHVGNGSIICVGSKDVVMQKVEPHENEIMCFASKEAYEQYLKTQNQTMTKVLLLGNNEKVKTKGRHDWKYKKRGKK